MKRLLFAFVALIATSVALPALASVRVVIDKSSQSMTVAVNGVHKYTWAVSTARSGYRTPTGTFTPYWLHRMHYSSKYDNAPMPHSIFFLGGYAIHGTNMTGQLGSPASHGCVRLAPGNAATLYALVSKHGKGNTRITVRQ